MFVLVRALFLKRYQLFFLQVSSSQLYLGSTLAAEILVAIFKPVIVHLSILKTDHSSPLLYHELDLNLTLFPANEVKDSAFYPTGLVSPPLLPSCHAYFMQAGWRLII